MFYFAYYFSLCKSKMSFLSILLVASAFYFAQARPDSQSWPDTAQPDTYPERNHPPVVPEEPSAPITDPADYQHQLYGFFEEISKAVDKYMTPLMTDLEKPKQDELKDMGMNGFASYINYWLLLIEEKKMEKQKPDYAYGQPHDDYLPRDEMILQFDSYYPLNPDTPYIADTHHEEDEEETEA